VKKITLSATTSARKKALAAAEKAGDKKAIEANKPWVGTFDAPENFAEMAKVWKPEDIYALAMKQWRVEKQAEIRNLHEPASPTARAKAIIQKILDARGIDLETLEKELLSS